MRDRALDFATLRPLILALHDHFAPLRGSGCMTTRWRYAARMNTPEPSPLKSVPADCSDLYRLAVRVAATGTNEELRAMVERLQPRGKLSLVTSRDALINPAMAP